MTRMTRSRHPSPTTADPLAVERCIVELQRGREAVLSDPAGNQTITLVETLTPELLASIARAGHCKLVLSAYRAGELGYHSDNEAVALNLDKDVTLEKVQQLAGLQTLPLQTTSLDQWEESTVDAALAGLQLARQAHALPALLLYPLPVGPGSILSARVADALQHETDTSRLMILSRTRIPLSGADSVELAVFRERHGSAEHVAITVGHPDDSQPVTVRLHSSCFTGDILGSLRCDCGEQLSSAIRDMAAQGGGVILYLSQEGRGIGLASKLRAYQLQDEGLDTLEANRHLGFGEDDRQYGAATTMLNALGIHQIRLVTNNPLKIEALRQDGIEVVDRLPSHATVNLHNARYLETKRTRAGHMIRTESLV